MTVSSCKRFWAIIGIEPFPLNNIKNIKLFSWIYLPALWFISIFLFSTILFAQEDIYQKNYKILGSAVEQKKKLLSDICDYAKDTAKRFSEDERILEFFKTKKNYYQKRKSVASSDKHIKRIEELKQNIQTYYFENYSIFYDALMIDTNGDIFFTIRKENDYHQNIFKGKLSNTSLSSNLRGNLSESFIDFQYFIPSKEPAAFFVEPVYIQNNLEGWFILQWSVNKINSLFEDSRHLGLTGEIILVNKDHFLLTGSRFKRDSSSLNLRLNSNNISSKFREKIGKKIVTDYRGIRVLSYFEVFNFLGTEWLISAKKDEDEVLTEYYKFNKNRLYPKIFKNYFENSDKGKIFHDDHVVKVDMEEFVRVNYGKVLYSKGVATCTGFIVSYPGKFAYMAHISPYDKTYNSEVYFTDLVGQILRRLPFYEICKNEYRNLKFYIIATHMNTIQNIVDLLIHNDFLLKQIYFFSNPEAERANIFFDTNNENIYVWWIIDSNSEKIAKAQTISDRFNIGERALRTYEETFQTKN